MVFKRNLRYGMRGADVRFIKERLHALHYYAPEIVSIARDHFGLDTLRAVRAFQAANRDNAGKRLMQDGVVGQKTWNAVLRVQSERAKETAGIAIPANIGEAAASAIAGALSREGETRRALVQAVLPYAFDPAIAAAYPHSLYIYGANLFNSALEREAVTPARIRAGAKRTPAYYSDGRMDMMLAAVAENPSISGADCSGGIVGVMRKLALVKPTFDTTANLFATNAHSSAIASDDLRPGDWVGRSGHIGVYVGGGYVVEWMGGAYGCQLNRLDARAGYDFVAKKLRRAPAWTRFRRPRYY